VLPSCFLYAIQVWKKSDVRLGHHVVGFNSNLINMECICRGMIVLKRLLDNHVVPFRACPAVQKGPMKIIKMIITVTLNVIKTSCGRGRASEGDSRASEGDSLYQGNQAPRKQINIIASWKIIDTFGLIKHAFIDNYGFIHVFICEATHRSRTGGQLFYQLEDMRKKPGRNHHNIGLPRERSAKSTLKSSRRSWNYWTPNLRRSWISLTTLRRCWKVTIVMLMG